MIFYNYLAVENPAGAAQWVGANGMRPAASPVELARQMQAIADRKGDVALKELAMIHPDAGLFTNVPTSGWNNACGGSYSNCGGCFSGADGNGQVIKKEIEQSLTKERDNTQLMILAGFVVLGLAVILKSN